MVYLVEIGLSWMSVNVALVVKATALNTVDPDSIPGTDNFTLLLGFVVFIVYIVCLNNMCIFIEINTYF